MRRLRTTSIVLVILLLASTSTSVRPEWSNSAPAWCFWGIASFKIYIDPLNDLQKSAGITEEFLRAAAEVRLRSAGIHVVDRGETSSPYFSLAKTIGIRLELVKSSSDPIYAYTVEMTVLTDSNTVCGPPSLKGFPQSLEFWRESSLGLVGGSSLKTAIRDDLQEQADSIANMYLKANPRLPTVKVVPGAQSVVLMMALRDVLVPRYLRNLKPRQKAEVKAVKVKKGILAAIGVAKRLGSS